MVDFRLVPEKSELSGLADEYWQYMSPEEQAAEENAFAAGEDIRRGNCTRTNLESIVRWKSLRTVHYLTKNADGAIQAALLAASDLDLPVDVALSELMKLRGVGLPVASAILTAIHPDRYTVIDFRALEALGHPSHDVSFYIAYLTFCLRLADGPDVKTQDSYPAPTALRALDRALWRWSKKNSETTSRSANPNARG